MRERSPVPCAQPSPRGDAPSPLAFAKSCKGGDVSVLDPALAWDVCFIYLFLLLVLTSFHLPALLCHVAVCVWVSMFAIWILDFPLNETIALFV